MPIRSGMASERPADPAARVSGVRWRTARRELDLSRPAVMGILNVTPDSFSDGGRYLATESARSRMEELSREGADIIDVGGESTRPGADPVSAAEEMDRVMPVIEAAAGQTTVPVSIDTTKAEVARAALDAGAEIINDVSGLRFDPGLGELAAERGAGLVLMHMRGRPRTMQRDIHYRDLMSEIVGELQESVDRALAAGCDAGQIVIDPGIGFGKTVSQSLQIIARVERLVGMGFPVMLGPSRKSFIGATLGLDVEERVEATIAACVLGLAGGARVFRVHDVGAARRALDMAAAIMGWGNGAEPA